VLQAVASLCVEMILNDNTLPYAGQQSSSTHLRVLSALCCCRSSMCEKQQTKRKETRKENSKQENKNKQEK
jgi:hypothetical protein